MAIKYEDLVKFAEDKGVNIKSRQEVKYGAYNIWLTKPELDFGYKIYTDEHLHPRSLIRDGEDADLFSDTDLDKMYTLVVAAYELGCHPKPIEIFKEGVISGINIKKANPATEELYNDRSRHIDFEGLKSHLSDSIIQYIIDKNRIHNYGEIDGKIVIIDFDRCTLNHYKGAN